MRETKDFVGEDKSGSFVPKKYCSTLGENVLLATEQKTFRAKNKHLLRNTTRFFPKKIFFSFVVRRRGK